MSFTACSVANCERCNATDTCLSCLGTSQLTSNGEECKGKYSSYSAMLFIHLWLLANIQQVVSYIKCIAACPDNCKRCHLNSAETNTLCDECESRYGIDDSEECSGKNDKVSKGLDQHCHHIVQSFVHLLVLLQPAPLAVWSVHWRVAVIHVKVTHVRTNTRMIVMVTVKVSTFCPITT